MMCTPDPDPIQKNDLDKLVHLAFALSQDHNTADEDTDPTLSSAKTIIDIDTNAVGFKFAGTATNETLGVVELAKAVASHDIDVCIVCDGATRYHTKRASSTRRVKWEQDKTREIVLRQELYACEQGAGDRTREVIVKELKTCQNSAERQLSRNFTDDIENKI